MRAVTPRRVCYEPLAAVGGNLFARIARIIDEPSDRARVSPSERAAGLLEAPVGVMLVGLGLRGVH
jgi:hypothetical protein